MSTKLHYYFSVILNRDPTEYEMNAYGQETISDELLVENIRRLSKVECKSAQEILCKIDDHDAYMIFLDLFITKHIIHGIKNIYNHCIHFYIKNPSSFLVDYLKYMYSCIIHKSDENDYDGKINVHLDSLFYTKYHYVLHNLFEVLSSVEIKEKCYIDLEYMYDFDIVFNVPKSNNLVFISP